MNFSELLRSHRLRAGWTQEELADKSGVSTHAINALERGRRLPRLSSAARLAAALGLTPAQRAKFIARAGQVDDPDAARVAAVPGRAVFQLPADLPDFTGRSDHVAALSSALLPPSGEQSAVAVVLSAVTGAGGIGKTSLAVHAAHLMRAHYPDGQLYAHLRGASQVPAEPADILGQFLVALGADPGTVPNDGEARAAAYRSLLADRRILVVLDDASGVSQVRPLIPGTAGSAVVVTSRDRLAGLDGAHRITLDTLSSADARSLFERIAGASAAAAEPEATAEVLAACCGFPLAIRIAAARLITEPTWTIRTLADRLTDRSRLLDELQLEDRGVRNTLAVSLGALGSREREAFVLLGLWTGADISTPAAAALFAVHPGEAQQLLDRLADAHLLECTGPRRYAAHDLVHLLAAELATEDLPPRRRREAVGRLVTWFLHSADRAVSVTQLQAVPIDLGPRASDAPLPVFEDSDRAKTWCEAELANLTEATLLAAEHGLDVVAWQLPKVLRPFYGLVTQWGAWEATHNAGLVSARRLDDQLAEAHMTNGLGSLAWQKRDLNPALDLHRHALALFRQAEDRQGELSALNNLGIDYAVLGDFEHARPIFQECVDLARAIGDPFPAIVAVQNLAECDVKLGNHHEATRTYARSLELARQHGIPTGEARALAALGEIHHQLQDLDAAERSLNASADLWREIKHPYRVADTLLKLGRVHRDADDHQAARRAWEEAHTGFAALQLPEATQVLDLLRELP